GASPVLSFLPVFTNLSGMLSNSGAAARAPKLRASEPFGPGNSTPQLIFAYPEAQNINGRVLINNAPVYSVENNIVTVFGLRQSNQYTGYDQVLAVDFGPDVEVTYNIEGFSYDLCLDPINS